MTPGAAAPAAAGTFRAALDEILGEVPPAKTRRVPLLKSLGTVLAEDLSAPGDVPAAALAATDGYAISAADAPGTEEASLRLVAFLRSGGAWREMEVRQGEAVKVEEGVVVPRGTAQVVAADRVREEGGFVTIAAGRPRSPNVIVEGADFGSGEVVLPAGTRVGPRQMAILSYFGVDRPAVRRLPNVCLLTVGSELCGLLEEPAPGAVRDVNAFLLAGIVKRLGGRCTLYGPAPDEPAAVAEVLARAVRDAGVVVVTGGLGAYGDVTPKALARLGFRERSRVGRIRPAGALRFGLVGDTPVFALPGHAFTAHAAFVSMVVPYLRRAAREIEWRPRWRRLPAAEGMEVNTDAVTMLRGEPLPAGDVGLRPLDRETYLHTFGEEDLFVVVDRGDGEVAPGQEVLAHPLDTDRL